MKRDLLVMTPEVKKVARKWLLWGDRHKRMMCPFPGAFDSNCKVCFAIFPRKSNACPCSVFGPKYVTKVVKQTLRDST